MVLLRIGISVLVFGTMLKIPGVLAWLCRTVEAHGAVWEIVAPGEKTQIYFLIAIFNVEIAYNLLDNHPQLDNDDHHHLDNDNPHQQRHRETQRHLRQPRPQHPHHRSSGCFFELIDAEYWVEIGSHIMHVCSDKLLTIFLTFSSKTTFILFHLSLSFARCSQSSRRRLVLGGTDVEHLQCVEQLHHQTRSVRNLSCKDCTL